MKNNVIYLYFDKSNRKNSKSSELIRIGYLIPKNEELIPDEKIKHYFINILYQCIGELEQLKTKNIILKYSIHIEKYNNVGVDSIFISNEKKEIYRIKDLIKELFYMFYIIYPYNKLSLNDLLNHASVKYIIKNYEKYINEEV